MNEDYLKVKRLRDDGFTLRQIGVRMGISHDSVRLILVRGERTYPALQWMDGLSTRAVNCLAGHGYTDKDQIAAALASNELKRVPGLGKTTLAEIRAWLA